jgi:hypothetical protein
VLLGENDFAPQIVGREDEHRHRLSSAKRRIAGDRSRMNDDVEARLFGHLAARGGHRIFTGTYTARHPFP